MTKATLRSESLPMKAQLSDLISAFEVVMQVVDYVRSEFYRIFYFVIDLMTLFAGLKAA